MALGFAMITLICLTITIVSQAIIDKRVYLAGDIHFNHFYAAFDNMNDCRHAQMVILEEAFPRISPHERFDLNCVHGGNPGEEELRRAVRGFFQDIEHVSAEAPTRRGT
jgi:hypothetical protein